MQDIPCSEYVPEDAVNGVTKSVEDDEASKFGMIIIIAVVVIVVILGVIVIVCLCKKKKADSLHSKKVEIITAHVAQADSVVVEDVMGDSQNVDQDQLQNEGSS